MPKTTQFLPILSFMSTVGAAFNMGNTLASCLLILLSFVFILSILIKNDFYRLYDEEKDTSNFVVVSLTLMAILMVIANISVGYYINNVIKPQQAFDSEKVTQWMRENNIE